MPLTNDPDTGESSDLAQGLDVHAALAGEPSLFDEASDFVTKAVPLTGLAVVNSFANTAVAVDNFFGGGAQKLTVQDEVGDGEMNDYYSAHQTGIEAAGLVVGSLIPGMMGVKALKLAQAGQFGETLARATSLFAGPKATLLANANAEMLAGDASLLGSLKADSYKAIALGFGDQALEGLAFTAASSAAQQGSPLLTEQGLEDATSDIAMGGLIGGVVGGTLSGLRTAWLFKKALLGASALTKDADIVTRYGSDLGNVLASDRALGIVAAVDKIPAQDTQLGQLKAVANKTASIMDAKIALKGIVDDPQIASDFIDALQTAKANGATSDQLYSKLNRLAKITRIGDEAEPPEAANTFFLNRFAKGAGAGFEQLMTKQPEAGAAISQRFMLTGDTAPTVARATDATQLADGTSFSTYTTSADAFEDGHDIFINKNLQVLVNPDSDSIQQIAREGESRALNQKEEKTYRGTTGQLPAGSAPLLGGVPKYGTAFEPGAASSFANKPMIFNLKTGDISEGATAVVGDYGKPQLLPSGLKFGEQQSTQSLTEGLIDANTSALEANARYTWANMRGIRTGDTISGQDIPLLEQLYREVTASDSSLDAFMKRKQVTLTGVVQPADADDLLSTIRNQKNSLLVDLLGQPKASAGEAALKAGVPQNYIADGMKGTDAASLLSDPAAYQDTNHVKLWYDIGNIHQQDGMIMQGAIDHQYRIQLIDGVVKSNLAKFVGDADWQRFIVEGKSSDATPEGAKAGFISSSQSSYGSLGQKAERVGRSVAQWLQQRSAAINDTLTPSINALRSDPAGTAELSMFTAVRQRTNQIYKFLPDQLAATHFPDLPAGSKVVVLRDSVQLDPKTQLPVWDKSYLPAGFVDGAGAANGSADKSNFNFYTLSKNVADFETATQQLNGARVQARNNLRVSQGLQQTTADADALYAPPIDTSKYKHFALVKQVKGLGGADDSVGMIVAQDASSLQNKIAALGNDFSVWTKDLLSKNHEVLGDYDGGRNFVDNKVNSEMSKRGILSDLYPDTRLDSLVQRHVDWNTASETALIRDHVETGNGQMFAELQAMGDRYTASANSTFGKTAGPLDSAPNDPYRSYINTALNLRPKDSYRAWYAANEKLESYFDTAFNTARNYFKAGQQGVVPFETAVEAAKKFGLGDVYGTGVDALRNYSDLTNKLPPQRYLSQFLAKASSAMNYTVIRLDAWQQLVHALSTPILIASELSSANVAVKDLVTTALPDGSANATMIPATSKLMYQAASNMFDSSVVDKYLPLYTAAGAIRNPEQELIHRAMREELQLPFGTNWKSESQLAASGSKILGYASKLSNWTEFATSWTAADAGRQLFEAKGLTGRELSDNISSFVNRVKGNMVASQRPVAFQGPIGQAIGMFQSYQFNMMQNIFRYVGDNDGRSLAIATGMQASLFGLGSLPGVQLLNSAIIGNAAGNTSHADIYSTLPSYFGKKISDYLMYGVASNVLNASLYTRGDMNPRNLTLLPVNPLNFPAIAGGIRLYQSLSGVVSKIAQGGDPESSILIGLEHNGLSRPLGGLAQLAQGFATTQSGKLISSAWPQSDPLEGNTAGLVDLFNAGVFSRLLGARPLDDAIAMEAEYRNTAYRAKDTARLEGLGAAVKTSLYGNQYPDSDQLSKFASQYAASGGRIEQFGRKMIEWSTQANASVANSAFRDLQRPLNQQMMKVMGGRQLQDFRMGTNQPMEPDQPVQ